MPGQVLLPLSRETRLLAFKVHDEIWTVNHIYDDKMTLDNVIDIDTIELPFANAYVNIAGVLVKSEGFKVENIVWIVARREWVFTDPLCRKWTGSGYEVINFNFSPYERL